MLQKLFCINSELSAVFAFHLKFYIQRFDLAPEVSDLEFFCGICRVVVFLLLEESVGGQLRVAACLFGQVE